MRTFALDPAQDGVTHINVYSQARTWLGQQLSNFAHTPIDHPELGHFESIEGLWYWLKSKDTRLRSLHGFEAKKLGRQVPQEKIPPAEFRAMLCMGLAAKLEAHPEIMRQLAESCLPLTHYYVYSGRVIEPDDNEWILAHFEAARAALNPAADMSNTKLMHEIAQRPAPAAPEEDQLSLF
ncbi:hypothetical protein HNP46_000371 [Pseudomonas nitritireducens]|uniref:Uncharacterized protein n=1 Tax=Pseudomonas nitroreducens TaxID=46680 RepID=A0A7W7NZQ4_PSENT|nr:hypothetical protein [Pseudomonas nitritireducens]MBB4861560.1 hypothetical protein [Pseudomonas nitritireducens]